MLSGLWDLGNERHGRPRSISAENIDGQKGGAGGQRQARVPTPLGSLASGGRCRPVSTCRPAPRLTSPG